MTAWQFLNTWLFWSLLVLMIAPIYPGFHALFWSKEDEGYRMLKFFLCFSCFLVSFGCLLIATVGCVLMCYCPISSKLLYCQ
jgi:hypothetical protein